MIISHMITKNLRKHREMQRFVRLHAPDIIAIKQQVQLLHAQRDHRISAWAWPVKLLALEAFVPENEAVPFPQQQLELVASSVDEREQCATSGILLYDILPKARQPVNLSSHVHK